MHCYKRGNVWWVGWRSHGVRHRHSLGVRSKKEVEKAVAGLGLATKAPTFERAVEILRLFYAEDNSALPLDKAWDTYREMLHTVGRDEIAAMTLSHRRQFLNRFLDWLKAHRPQVRFVESVDEPTAADYARHVSTLTNAKGEPLAKKTRKNLIDELKGVWAILAKVSPTLRNPWTGLVPSGASVDSVRIPMFTEEQERAVMAAAEKVGKGWPLACLIARHTGLRYGDVARLRWDEIDLDGGILRHVPSKTRKHGVAVEIPLVAPLLDALRRERDAEADDACVLPNHAALYALDSSYRQTHLPFREVLDAAGVPKGYTFHSWRHTAASRLAHAGADIETRKRILGHTTDAMAEHYDQDPHLDEKRRALEAAAALG